MKYFNLITLSCFVLVFPPVQAEKKELACFDIIHKLDRLKTIEKKEDKEKLVHGVNIHTFIKKIAKELDITIQVDPRIKGNIILYNPKKYKDKEKTLAVLQSVLNTHHASLIKDNGIIKILPNVSVKQKALPLLTNQDKKILGQVSKIIKVKHIPANQLVPILRPLLPNTAQLSAYAANNTLLITGEYNNVKRIEKIVSKLDFIPEKTVKVKIKIKDNNKIKQLIEMIRKQTIKIQQEESTNSLIIQAPSQNSIKLIKRLLIENKTDFSIERKQRPD